MNILITE